MYLDITDIAAFADQVSRTQQAQGGYAVVFLAREHHAEVEDIIDALNARDVAYFGAIFPALLESGQRYDRGAVVNVLPVAAPPTIARFIDGERIEWDGALPTVAGTQATAFVLVDSRCGMMSELLAELYDHHGNTVQYLGAGAGRALPHSTPCLFSPQGYIQQAAIVATVNGNGQTIARHGWERLRGPVVATRTHKNIVHEFNWEPALPFYREFLREHLGDLDHEASLLETSKRFPFGIYKEGQEDIVRDVVRIDGDSICFAGAIPENSVLHILHGNVEQLVNGCGDAFTECAVRTKGDVTNCIVFDCFTRTALLADDFSLELETIERNSKEIDRNLTPWGALVLGEIASDGERLPEFHNKTCVVGLFNDQT